MAITHERRKFPRPRQTLPQTVSRKTKTAPLTKQPPTLLRHLSHFLPYSILSIDTTTQRQQSQKTNRLPPFFITIFNIHVPPTTYLFSVNSLIHTQNIYETRMSISFLQNSSKSKKPSKKNYIHINQHFYSFSLSSYALNDSPYLSSLPHRSSSLFHHFHASSKVTASPYNLKYSAIAFP